MRWYGLSCAALWFHALMSWCHMELLKLLLRNTFSGKDFVFTLHLLLPQLPRTRCRCSCIPQPKQPRLELGTKGPKHPTAMPGPAPSAVGLECHGPWWERSDSPTWESQVDVTLPFLPTAVRFQGCLHTLGCWGCGGSGGIWTVWREAFRGSQGGHIFPKSQ